MGCNESKHEVVTGNTVTKKQPPLRKKSSVIFRKSKDLEIIPEITEAINFAGINSSSSALQQESNNNNNNNNNNKKSIKTENNDLDDELVGNTSVKDITVNTELKEKEFWEPDGKKEDEVVKKLGDENNGDGEEHGRMIVSSPDHYFSSRKNDDAVAAIVAEEEEEEVEFEYHSPVHELAKDGSKSVESRHEEEEGILMEKKGVLKETITDEVDHNAKSVDLKDQNLIKEAKVVTIANEDSSSTTSKSVDLKNVRL